MGSFMYKAQRVSRCLLSQPHSTITAGEGPSSLTLTHGLHSCTPLFIAVRRIETERCALQKYKCYYYLQTTEMTS